MIKKITPKKHFSNFFSLKKAVVLFVIFPLTISAQTYTISNWFNGKKACAVLTYDDWLDGHGPIAIPQLVARNMVGSFYVNAEWAQRGGGYPQMNYAISKGIEIGNHTVSHRDLATISLDSAKYQINAGADSILANTVAQGGLTFAYPFGSYNTNVINAVKQKHFVARAVWGNWFWFSQWRYNFLTNNNGAINPYYEITTYQVTSNHTLPAIATQMSNALTNGGIISFMFHEIYNDTIGNSIDGYDKINEQTHGAFLDFIKTYENNFWVPTFMNAMKYHKEKNCATLSTISNTTSSWKLNLKDTLSNNSIYNHPLTINLTVPQNETILDVKQNGIGMTYQLVGTTLTFNAVPDGGEIEIVKELPTGLVNPENIGLLNEIYPNPTSDNINLVLNGNYGNCLIHIINQNGQIVKSENAIVQGYQIHQLTIADLSAGMYTIRVVSASESAVKQFVIAR